MCCFFWLPLLISKIVFIARIFFLIQPSASSFITLTSVSQYTNAVKYMMYCTLAVQCTLLCPDLSTCILHRRLEKPHEHNCFQRGATWGSPETETRRHAVPGSSFSQAHIWMWFQLMLEHTIHLERAHRVYHHAMYEVHSEDSTKKANGILCRWALLVV